VTQFVEALKDELEATLKNPVTIYFDENPHDGLLETHQVRASLDKKLKCIVFIPIISQTYCDTKSFAWEHELLPFLEMAREDELGMNITLANGNVASRVLPVQIHDLDSEDQSVIEGELGGPLRSIKFIHQAAGVNRPLNKEDDQVREAGKILYSDQTNKVANALKEIGTSVLRNTKTKNGDTLIKAKEAKPESIKKRTSKVLLKMILGLLFLPFVFGAAYYLYMNYGSRQNNPAYLEKSIAVLPFVDMSPNKDQEYLSDGISEELISALAKLPNLKVVGRTSSFAYKDKNENLKKIGEDLQVATILEGSLRKSGNIIRISAQLINANTGFQLWAETYETELTEIFGVQDEITAAIMEALNIHLGGTKIKFSPTASTNPEAYSAYLRARQNLAQRGEYLDDARTYLDDARTLFEEAIQHDPNFSPSYSGLGRTLSLIPNYTSTLTTSIADVVLLSKKAANKALELDPDNAEAYSVLGSIAMYYDWDWAEAELMLKKSVTLSPNNAEMNNFLGDYYVITLDEEKAIEIEGKALELDPRMAINFSNLIWAYMAFEDWDNVIRVNNLAKSLSISLIGGDEMTRALINLKKGNIDRAQEIMDSVQHISGPGEYQARTVLAFAKADWSAQEIEQLVEKYPENFLAMRAEAYLKLKQWDKASYWLEQAYSERDPALVYLPRILLPEDYPDHPALQKAFDKPELNALFEIRRKNLKNNKLNN